jgi:hypothetical protein
MLPYHFHRLTRTGAFAPGPGEMVRETPPETGNALKRALWRHYVKQYHESSCSVAAVATVINALGEVTRGRADNVTQLELLDRVEAGNWKKRMSPEGDDGKHGMPFGLFGEVVRGSIDAFRIPVRSVESVDLRNSTLSEREKKELLRRRLEDFETLGNGVIIIHFDQGAYVPDLNIPHISPVGGYDTATDRVTIMDVDRTLDWPYSISFDRFYRASPSRIPFPSGWGRCQTAGISTSGSGDSGGLDPDQDVEIEECGNKHGQAWYPQVAIDPVQGGFEILVGQEQADMER